MRAIVGEVDYSDLLRLLPADTDPSTLLGSDPQDRRPTTPVWALLADAEDLRSLIQSTQTGVAQTVSSALVLLILAGRDRIRTDVLHLKQTEFGAQILPTLSAKLVPEYGQGFSERNPAHMVRFAKVFPAREVVLLL